ncbi:MAG: transcriptional repressor [Lachnospiraceae bacterium]|nr:transcriptional repressor [Lachnospiraceae bacterium]
MKSIYKTKAREEIISFLKTHNEQRFTARDIYETVSIQNPGVNRTTVYRNLDRLCESGELLKFKESNQDAWYYQYSSKHEHCDKHMHAQCSVCGRIFHLDKPFVKVFDSEMLKEYGLDIDPSKTIILGSCKDCRKMKKK